MKKSYIIFWLAFSLIILSNVYLIFSRNRMNNNILIFHVLLTTIGLVLIVLAKEQENYYNYALKKGYVVGGGAVYSQNPANYPGLGWVL